MRQAPLSFPNLRDVKIHDSSGTVSINLAPRLDVGQCIGHPLKWGHVVEIPEADQRINETWRGLLDEKTYDERTDLWLRDGDVIEVS